MSHLFKTDTSIFKAGDNIFKVNDKLNVIIQNKGGFGATIEGLRFDLLQQIIGWQYQVVLLVG
jgi:hypothetical protein